MQDYRAYIMGPDGHVQNRVDLQCEKIILPNSGCRLRYILPQLQNFSGLAQVAEVELAAASTQLQ